VLLPAQGLLVHSRYVEEQARKAGFAGPIWHVPHPAWEPPRKLPDAQLPEGRFPVIGCFGNLTTTKRVPQLVAAFARLRDEFPNALLLLVGRATSGVALEPELDRHRVPHESVVRLDYVDEARLWALMSAADVSVNLRWPTMGETSGTAIRSLVLGRPLVVSDVGWFSELPAGVVEKIAVGAHEVELLAETLARLSRDAGLRDELGAAANAYVRREHDLDRVADAYVAALEDAAGRPLVQNDVVAQVAKAGSEVGLEPRSAGTAAVGEALSEVGLGD
jgi:glycosyltransferase involved in cell wall biosynthesis